MKHITILTGAGISAESGLETFRAADGLWKNFEISDVADIKGWDKNPKLVLEFYNQRRKDVIKSKPNSAHYALTKLEKHFNVDIITQNIDDLHERAESSNILHLHGNILKSQSCKNSELIYDVEGEINIGDVDEHGNQLRPAVVWFGENVPNIQKAISIINKTDLLIIIGTSLSVFPAAGLIRELKNTTNKIINVTMDYTEHTDHIIYKEKASSIVPKIINNLINDKELLNVIKRII